jgi:glycerol-3-phosphate dehydrogenase
MRACTTATSPLPPLPDDISSDEEILRAVRQEMALTLDDLVMRRTGTGLLGHPGTGTAVLERNARLMAAELGWSDDRRAQEIAAVERNFRIE